MEKQIKLTSVSEFVKFLMKQKMTDKKRINIINNYISFLEDFKYSYIWTLDENNNFLYRRNGVFGYYEFDGSSYGKFIEVSEETYKKAEDKIMLIGDIEVEHKGKMYTDSTRFWRRLAISNVYGMYPKTVEELIKYDLYLTENCLTYLGF